MARVVPPSADRVIGRGLCTPQRWRPPPCAATGPRDTGRHRLRSPSWRSAYHSRADRIKPSASCFASASLHLRAIRCCGTRRSGRDLSESPVLGSRGRAAYRHRLRLAPPPALQRPAGLQLHDEDDQGDPVCSIAHRELRPMSPSASHAGCGPRPRTVCRSLGIRAEGWAGAGLLRSLRDASPAMAQIVHSGGTGGSWKCVC